MIFLLVVKRCAILGCNSLHASKVSFFHFPRNFELANKWYSLLKNGLPENLSVTNLKSKVVCDAHFSSCSYYSIGSRKILRSDVVPKKIQIETLEKKETPAQIITRLRAKYNRLQARYNKLYNDPSPAFIKSHKHKLKEFMSDDAFTLFDSCVTNYLKSPHARRHSYATKKVANKIWAQSKVTYRLIRPIFALPSLRTLDRHNADNYTSTGISKETEALLKLHAENLEMDEKHCILSFDEVEINSSFVYLPRLDIVCGFVDMGKHGRRDQQTKSVLVFGLRGIDSRWKQIISYYFVPKSGFVASDLKPILEENLEALFRAGYNVVSTVCDGDAKNRLLSQLVNANSETTKFEFQSHMIHFLFDVPHIFKLIRNNLIRHRLYVDFDENYRGIVTWEDILNHLEPIVESSDIIKECPKLTTKHLHPNTFEKMRVCLATQLLSHSVSASFDNAVKRGSLPENPYALIATLIKELDKLFDILNSSTLSQQDGKPWATALRPNDESSTFLKLWLQRLDSKSIFYLTSDSTFASPKSVNQVHCLNMLAQSIRGILSISLDLQTRGINKLATRRLNQDILENFFAQIRKSASDLTPQHFRAHFRSTRILFMEKLPSDSNCEQDDDFPLFLEDLSSDSATEISEETQASPETALAEYYSIHHPEIANDPQLLSDFLTTFASDDLCEDHAALTNHEAETAASSQDRTGLRSYIAGYIIRKIKKAGICCDICLPTLNTESLSLPAHQFILSRLYDPNRPMSLHFPTKSFVDLISSSMDKLEIETPRLFSVVGVKFSLSSSIWNLDFNWIPLCHQHTIKWETIRRLVNMYIGKHIKDKNRLSRNSKSVKSIQKASRPS